MAKNRTWTRSTAPCYVENHHIIPIHAGGCDKANNKVFLTHDEHIEAHRLLHKKYGNKFDLFAVSRMTGFIGKEMLKRLISSENGKKSKGRKMSPESSHKKSLAMFGRKNALGWRASKEQTESRIRSISKEWKVTTPNGEVMFVCNLKKFCREYGLHSSHLSDRGIYKKWKCERILL